MKKFLFFAFILLISINILCISCFAQNVVGSTVYTDIIASINDYNIESYNINGNTSVVAEDLRNYGFDVVWNGEERTLRITRGWTNNIQSTYIAPEISKSQIGAKAHDILSSDIKVYINNELVDSYNINGKTIVNFDDLSVFGNVKYDDTTRRLDLDINDGLNYKISPPIKFDEKYSPSGLYFKMNSADGLQIRWTATNNTNKTINYYTTKYYMFNSVGDFAYDRYGNNCFEKKTVGPVTNGEMILNYTSKYKAESYDVPCDKVFLYNIFLEYSDGTSETIYYGYSGEEARGEFVL